MFHSVTLEDDHLLHFTTRGYSIGKFEKYVLFGNIIGPKYIYMILRDS